MEYKHPGEDVPIGLDGKLMAEHGVIFKDFKRLYRIDIFARGYDYGGSTPEYFRFEQFECSDHSWLYLIESFGKYMVMTSRFSKPMLLGFHTKWSKQNMFVDKPAVNHREIGEGLYINCNHTAVHAIWFLADLIQEFFQSNEAELILRRPPNKEPDDLKPIFISAYKKGFRDYLINVEHKEAERADKIIQNIEGRMNSLAYEAAPAFGNWFLISDMTDFSGLKSRFLSHIKSNHPEMPQKNIEIFDRYLRYMHSYLKRCINSNSF